MYFSAINPNYVYLHVTQRLDSQWLMKDANDVLMLTDDFRRIIADIGIPMVREWRGMNQVWFLVGVKPDRHQLAMMRLHGMQFSLAPHETT